MKDKIENILAIVTGFTILFLLTKYNIFLNLAILIGLISLISDRSANKISYYWVKFSLILGKLVSKVVLSFVFIIFLVPLAILAKIFSKRDSLFLKKKAVDSYYVIRGHDYLRADLENIW